MSKEAENLISSWIDNAQDGDSVRIVNGEIVICNSLGCEIAREYV